MHVLLIPKWYPGPRDPQLGDFIRKQALALARHTPVSVLVVQADPDAPAPMTLTSGTVDGLWELRAVYCACTWPLAPLRKAVNLWRHLRTAARALRVLERDRPAVDLVLAYILVRPALTALRLRRRGIPFVLAEQSSEYLDGTFDRKGPLFRAFVRAIARRARAFIAVSPHLGAALARHGLCTDAVVVPNTIPGLDRPLPPAGPPGHFLMVADLVDRIKRVSGVLRALAQARAHEPSLRLTVIGDGPDRADLEALTRALGLADHVRFLGRLPNAAVLDHMARTFAVVVNSRVETFSVVTGEALAQGRPVIATRCGGPEAFITPMNGLLIPVDDDAVLADALVRLTREADRYRPDAIRAGVNDRYGPDAVGRTLLRALQQAR
ncbi:MAG: glycosyltransferase [Flavobacteriales bacterium]|nr:glycosyltransferase [Flavobacteriales bacterium]